MYNGLVKPSNWPPILEFNGRGKKLPIELLTPLDGVYPIDIGRQLFVDDFLIYETSMNRTFYSAQKSSKNPVLVPETTAEKDQGECPVAAPFNDGVWWDSREKVFKMWYHAGWMRSTGYATSDDGINWVRPKLDVVSETNLVLPTRKGYLRDGCCVWLDENADKDVERYKMLQFFRKNETEEIGEVYVSEDGIHWGEPTITGPMGDNSTFFYNPFLKKWVFSLRTHHSHNSKENHRYREIRTRSYIESDSFKAGSQWSPQDPAMWAWSDYRDEMDPLIGDEPQLYDINANAYESLMLGLFAIYCGPSNLMAEEMGVPKTNDLKIAFSRDGFHWDRGSTDEFIPSERNNTAWDKGYIHAAGGTCLIVKDRLYFYYGAWSGLSPNLKGNTVGSHRRSNAMYAGGATGLATLRRDGFASMDSGRSGASLITHPVKFSGNYLFVNCDSSRGELEVEILDNYGDVIHPYTADNCVTLSCDSSKQIVKWSGVKDLRQLSGRTVRFRFNSTDTKLFSFWVSQWKSGESNGYVAAGGPGFSSGIDSK